jgi:hypothetical protein
MMRCSLVVCLSLGFAASMVSQSLAVCPCGCGMEVCTMPNCSAKGGRARSGAYNPPHDLINRVTREDQRRRDQAEIESAVQARKDAEFERAKQKRAAEWERHLPRPTGEIDLSPEKIARDRKEVERIRTNAQKLQQIEGRNKVQYDPRSRNQPKQPTALQRQQQELWKVLRPKR